jgi:REP element-mobilizing transposase RayT
MILASHVIITAYGFWLPNDPRGSWSDFVGAWELFRFGPATKTNERRSLARDEHDRGLRLRAKRALKYPPVEFTGQQALLIAKAFEKASADKGYHFYALSILPSHIHAVVGRHDRDAEHITGHLKFVATRKLIEENVHPFQTFRRISGQVPTMWTKRGWKVFLDSHEDIERAVRYVEENPLKEGKRRRQRWSSVLPHDDHGAPRTRGG